MKATTPSTVRHTIGLLEERLVMNPSAVGHYLLPRLPQKNPPEEKKIVLEDLGAKVRSNLSSAYVLCKEGKK